MIHFTLAQLSWAAFLFFCCACAPVHNIPQKKYKPIAWHFFPHVFKWPQPFEKLLSTLCIRSLDFWNRSKSGWYLHPGLSAAESKLLPTKSPCFFSSSIITRLVAGPENSVVAVWWRRMVQRIQKWIGFCKKHCGANRWIHSTLLLL